ncbi:MAG: hypothetical protein ACLFTP_09725 [Rhodosalinus sp.]
MIFDRIGHLLAFFGGARPEGRRAARDVGRRWSRVFSREPELAEDLIRMGGVLAAQPVEMVDGFPQVAAPDPYRLAYEAGRRDMALALLSAGGVTPQELSELMEASHVD